MSAPSQADDSLGVWSLFADKLALQRQLTRAVCGSVAAITGVDQRLCFIGRGNHRTNRAHYIMTYWE